MHRNWPGEGNRTTYHNQIYMRSGWKNLSRRELSQPKNDVLAKDLNFGGIPSSRPHHGHGICHQEQLADRDKGRTTKAKSIGCVHQSESTTFQPHHPGPTILWMQLSPTTAFRNISVKYYELGLTRAACLSYVRSPWPLRSMASTLQVTRLEMAVWNRKCDDELITFIYWFFSFYTDGEDCPGQGRVSSSM